MPSRPGRWSGRGAWPACAARRKCGCLRWAWTNLVWCGVAARSVVPRARGRECKVGRPAPRAFPGRECRARVQPVRRDLGRFDSCPGEYPYDVSEVTTLCVRYAYPARRGNTPRTTAPGQGRTATGGFGQCGTRSAAGEEEGERQLHPTPPPGIFAGCGGMPPGRRPACSHRWAAPTVRAAPPTPLIRAGSSTGRAPDF